MKRAALIAVAAALLTLTFMLASVTVGAAEDEPFVIDDMSSASEWSSVAGRVSYMRYGTETEYLSSGDEDTGYLTVRSSEAVSGTPLEVSRAFSERVDLFRYDGIGFYINITDVGVSSSVEYIVTVTLYSRGPSYSYDAACRAGEWVRFDAPIGDYSLRTDIVGISVSVTARTEIESPFTLSFRLDGVEAFGLRDTSLEERFLCQSFESRGGRIVYDEGGFYSLTYSSGRGRILGYPTVRNRDTVSSNDIIRFTVSSIERITAELEVTYLDGSVYTTDTVSVSGGGVATALGFELDGIGNIYSFSLNIYGEAAGEVRLYGVGFLTLPESSGTGAGTVDVCRVLAGGEVNLRGTVPSATVADYIDGDISVFCVPVYGNAEEYISGAEPCVTIDITTRFNITISPSSLPTGYHAMRFVAVICRGEERVMISSPRLPSFADDVGARLPAGRGSIKGMTNSPITAGSAVTVIDVDLPDLFGTALSGRLYSFGGGVYYFDNGYIAGLDGAIKSASLTGTSCILRLRDPNGRVGFNVLSADNETDFSELYAAVDYLTSRYSSVDNGFISGIAVGDSIYTDRYGSETAAAERALTEARALSTVYQIGRGNIAGFRVMLPIGGMFANVDAVCDAADMMRCLSVTMGEFGSVPYDIMITSDAPMGIFDAAASYAGALGRNVPESYYIVYAPKTASSARALFADYAEMYYDACARSEIAGFVLSFNSDGISDADMTAFYEKFYLLDTNEYAAAESYAGIPARDDFPERTHPITVMRGDIAGTIGGVTGSYNIFDFTDSFDTAGWFSFSGDGECLTVRTSSGRALRADAESRGAMYSCAQAPLDLSLTPFLRIEAYDSDAGEYELAVYSDSAVYHAAISLREYSSAYVADLSDFPGVGAVTGISLTPLDGGGTFYLSRVTVCSRTYGDDDVRDMFSASLTGNTDDAGEDNMLEIMAVSLISLAVGAAAVAVIGARSRDGRRHDEQV